MKKEEKNILMTSVTCDKFKDFKKKFKRHKLSLHDNSFFDYDLLKAALIRKDKAIANFLVEVGCRVRNPSKDSEESPLHLAVILNSSSIITKILKSRASIYDKNYKGETPLYLAFKEMYLKTFPSWKNLDCAIDTVLNYYYSEDNEQSNTNLVSVDPSNKDDILHFHIACISNKVNAVKFYLKNGFDVNTPFSFASAKFNGLYPLHYAAMKKHVNLIECLLQHGADISIPNSKGDTALHILHNLGRLAVHENQDMISQVYRDGNNSALINCLDRNGISHFHLCCSTNHYKRVQAFLESGAEVDNRVKSGCFAGCTPLHFAVLHNKRDVVEMLLKWHAQVNIKTSEQQLTPLHVACNYFNMKFLEIREPKKTITTTHCFGLNISNFERSLTNRKKYIINWTSEHNNQLKIIELLLLHGADVNAKDSAGITPLLSTFMSPEEQEVSLSSDKWDLDQINSQIKKIVQILFSKGANMNALTHSQESVIHIISQNNYLRNSEEWLEFFANKGVDIHAADVDGFTPLHVAVKSKSKMCIEFLLKHGVNVNAKSKDFKIPLNFGLDSIIGLDRYSFLNDEDKILLLLLKYGSDVNFRYKNDKILWLDALEKCDYSIVQNLLNYVDINMKDAQGNPLIVSVLSKWLNHTSREAKDDVFCVIFAHIKKLIAAGFYVNVKVKRCCNKLNQYYKNLLNYNLLKNGFSNNCIKELSRMKLIEVGYYISLYNILLKDTHELSKQVKNNALVKILEDKNFVDNFPLYSSLLKARFNKGRTRSDILKSSNQAFRALIGLDLPDLCLDLIFKHLTNEEIANLKTAASKTTTNKRKINDCSKMEPPTRRKRSKMQIQI